MRRATFGVVLTLTLLFSTVAMGQTPAQSVSFLISPAAAELKAITPAPDFPANVVVYAKFEAMAEVFRVRFVPVTGSGTEMAFVADVTGESGKWNLITNVQLPSGFNLAEVRVSRMTEGSPSTSTLVR